nr:ATP-binding protein [Nocardioides convexus]
MLERVARGRPERSLVLTGLRGVGKTVLLNALRSAAVRKGWGTGKARGPSGPVAASATVLRAAPGGPRAWATPRRRRPITCSV